MRFIKGTVRIVRDGRRFEPRPRDGNFYTLLLAEPFWITSAKEGPPTILKNAQELSLEDAFPQRLKGVLKNSTLFVQPLKGHLIPKDLRYR